MLVRVFVIPPEDGRYCFYGGKAVAFTQVDWFRDDEGDCTTEEGRKRMETFIRAKQYCGLRTPLLVLHPTHPFTINYEAP